MEHRPLAVLVLAASASLSILTAEAVASCMAPTILPTGPAVRGEVVTVRGSAFGDDCHDTGSAPAGEGVLGTPVPDIELFVAQGEGDALVARGAADADYEFSVDIVVPPRLSPGSARLVARWGEDRSTEESLEVLADPPAVAAPETTPIVPFGPVADPSVSEADEDVERALVGGALAAVAIGATGAVWRWRRSQTR